MIQAVKEGRPDPNQPVEEEVLVNLHMEENFRQYVQGKYYLEDETILEDSKIMQMIYALEWFDIPRTMYSDLIEFHPYLNASDHDKLFYVNTQHRIENGISWLLFSLITNRYALKLNSTFARTRWLRLPACFLAGGVLAYGVNMAFLRTIYLSDLGEMGLTDKYFSLDLNAEMMKEDLSKIGIHINARHFDMDAAQARAEEQTDTLEGQNDKEVATPRANKEL